jgi:solute carrier family 25 S-adenosylmethionine transporter 26
MPNPPINYRDIRNLPALFDNAYQGVSLPLLTNIPAGAVFFAVKDAVQAALSQSETVTTRNPNVDRIWRTCCAVAVAQIPYWIVRNPSEVVKTRQQAKIPPYDKLNAIDAYWQVRQDRIVELQQLGNTNANVSSSLPLWATIGGGGWDAYYTGYFENVLYAYPADVIKFVVYEQLSASILQQQQQQQQQQNNEKWSTQRKKKLSPIQGALAGATATAVAQFLTTPFDVVRNRIMADTGPTKQRQRPQSGEMGTTNKNESNSVSVLSSYWNELATLAREEGWQGLFAGATPRVGKALLSGAIQFATYEETKQQVAQFFQRKE